MAHTKCQVSNCRVFRIWHGLFSIFKVSESWVSTSVKSLPSPTPVNNKAIKQRRWLSYLFCPQASKTIYIFVVVDLAVWHDKVTFTTKSYQPTCCYSVWSPNQQFPDWSDWLDPLLTTHLPLSLLVFSLKSDRYHYVPRLLTEAPVDFHHPSKVPSKGQGWRGTHCE